MSRRPYEPLTNSTPDPDGPAEPSVPDADPCADVYVRADREVFGTPVKKNRRAYHLFVDCQHLATGTGRVALTIADVWVEGLPVCLECQKRERVRSLLAGGVPPNPDPSDEWLGDDAVGSADRRRQNADDALDEGGDGF